ncbi:BQ5605_C004g02695 [Microbotryum silenes-dioicae]|uniref:BQ5605_C004g02695 protein n=1 Tax=Microbotryum silenes-dioicae TaxID=796604 RepID=A0A2X0PAX2_9BASI|nr:BQ5605_C004g02695 [Microbotryum silenes-dioicae]
MAVVTPSRRLAVLSVLLVVALVVSFSASSKQTLRKLASASVRAKFDRLTDSETVDESTRPFPFIERDPVSTDETTAVPLVQAIAEFNLLDQKNRPTQFNLSLCSIATHEEEFLVEWITWHRLLGVERIYLFDNKPTLGMRKLLRPWLEEGSVVLYELKYPDDVLVGAHHRDDLLRLCEREVLSTSLWAAHIDVDEFLVLESTSSKAQVPRPIASGKLSQVELNNWDYPLHHLLSHELRNATCVPIPRITFTNVGVREIGMEYVTERHVVREKKDPGRKTWGKMLLQWPDPNIPRPASWWGAHSCQASNGDRPEANIIMDALGNRLKPPNNIYPMKGLVLPDNSLGINHYAQRSLANCIAKAEVAKDVHTDWRAIEGPLGCASHYVPTEQEMKGDERTRILEHEKYGAELLASPKELIEDGIFEDMVASESWQGRMTRAILDEWRSQSSKRAWPWESIKWDWKEHEVSQIGIRVVSAPVRQGD